MSISLLGTSIDYRENGAGPCLVLVPGSFATTAAWRPIADILKDDFRIVSTSLPGYGGTEERRTDDDTSIDREAEVIEAVIERAGSRVHLVGHSHGGAVALAVAFRRLAPITSLALIEPMVCDLLRQNGDAELFAAVRDMSAAYVEAYRAGEKSAARRVLDFWAGAGSFDRLPVKVRAYVERTTPTNILDWQSVYGLDRPISDYVSLDFPVSIMRGTNSHPAAGQISATLARIVPRARLTEIANASHFVINTHPREVARLISEHVTEAERQHRETS